MSAEILYEARDSLPRIVLNLLENMNGLTPAMLDALPVGTRGASDGRSRIRTSEPSR